MAVSHFDRSIPTMLADLLTQVMDLVRKETKLARTEVSEKMSQMAAGLATVAVGAVLLIPALVILLMAAVAGLEQMGLASYWSELIIGGAVLIIGFILLMIGVGRLKAANLMPEKTINQLQEDASVAKRQMRPSHDHERAA
jgi:hypothetical protein